MLRPPDPSAFAEVGGGGIADDEFVLHRILTLYWRPSKPCLQEWSK
jgi:hypothetical protein